MEKNYVLPYRYKKIGLYMFIPFCAFVILFIFGLSYLYFTYLAIFLMPIVYIAKFNLAMRKIRKEDNEK